MADYQNNQNYDENEEEHLRNNNTDNQDNYNALDDIDKINEEFIPINSIIDNYNEHFYELFLKIKLIRNEIKNINNTLKDYIIEPTKINLDDELKISVNCLKSLVYLIDKFNISNQHITRIVICDTHFNDIFDWNSIYNDRWNEELHILGI